MNKHFKSFSLLIIYCSFHIMGHSQSITAAIERQFNKVERDILTTAEAMPEDKFQFTPEKLAIKDSEFKGVRSFGGQIMHVATDNQIH